MILSNIELDAEIKAGRLVIEPLPPTNRFSGASVDLTLHDEIFELPSQDSTGGQPLDPSHPNFNVPRFISERYRRKSIVGNGGYPLEPNRLTLCSTHESVTLPLHLSARIEGRSSLARLGISVHATAPTVLPGFSGRLTLEINNVGPFQIILKPKLVIAQLIVERVGLPATNKYEGQFQHQGQ